ncbi:hypothetical protein GDO81_023037 [Engystomops pustulosus]|uniref:Uncharacterized protein n=1 Tax=Engystomops pustulosus TaxID=76066 RepID=A0AAV6ZA58_ENGPU|nr:hypothetical protein GDO81_023037 [Engystomops pustulosus]
MKILGFTCTNVVRQNRKLPSTPQTRHQTTKRHRTAVRVRPPKICKKNSSIFIFFCFIPKIINFYHIFPPAAGLHPKYNQRKPKNNRNRRDQRPTNIETRNIQKINTLTPGIYRESPAPQSHPG